MRVNIYLYVQKLLPPPQKKIWGKYAKQGYKNANKAASVEKFLSWTLEYCFEHSV